MSAIAIATTASEKLVSAVLRHRNEGQIGNAVASFAEEFRFKDYGIGLEFCNKGRLAEFFQKAREFYLDSFFRTDTIFSNGNHVITQWTLQATTTEPFDVDLSRKVPVFVHGTSVVRTDNGKVADWADYYDGLTSRRIALATYFGKRVGH